MSKKTVPQTTENQATQSQSSGAGDLGTEAQINATTKTDGAHPAELMIFDVMPDSGEIVLSDYEPNTDRYTAYDVSPDELQFGEGFYDLLDRIEELRSEIYWRAVEPDGDDELEDYETGMIAELIDALPDQKRTELSRQLQRWFECEPDFEERDSNDIVRPMDGRQFAFELFWNYDPEILDALQISVVEGEHPGSSYYAPEMEGPVDEANRIAEERGLPWRFRLG
ncbi:hypothetical protein [Maritimibacter fusiformis]|uniref:Uncharacterized protein n=1 Tax=Maritimibacter fusiformis TaxID=2603819 RepID=A0A5D0RRG0_9RHOB|nr:hypothetical protein [Maritimibacter fusiformis]TYB83111.1 hypothetical protein FVF75_02715 [Maritimibacter fusiformis]